MQWEQQPTLNPETGYPDKFTQLPTQVSIDIWSNVKHLSLCFGRYVTLLISLHGTGLYERFTSWKKSYESTGIVQSFLKNEYAFQKEIIEILKKDKYYSQYMSSLQIERNRNLVAVWDAMSIILCTGKKGEEYINQVPTINGTTTLKLALIEGQEYHQTIIVTPWPFEPREVNLVYEGRLLQKTFSDEAAMREALSGDYWVTLNTTLRPE